MIDARTVLDDKKLRARVEELFVFWEDGSRLGPTGAERLVTALAHDVDIRQPLGVLVDQADREVLRLSDQQYGVLLTLSAARRVAVSGPAGSGKTLVAAEKAKRLALQGKRTLLVCFNRPLADYLRESLSDAPELDVWSYHQLSRQLALEARLPLPSEPWGQREWDQVALFLEPAAARLGSRYDAMVVDEAQDFSDSWWLPLLTLLHDPDHGILYVFYDANQAIYRQLGSLPDGLLPTHLYESFRSTRPMFDAVMRHYQGEPIVCRGPDGPPVDNRTVPARELRRELGRTLHRLIIEGDLEASQVVVLTSRTVATSAMGGRVGSFYLTPTPRERGDIKLSTIHRFKGLDAKAVVVCEISRKDPKFPALMYVACSRARSLLAVLLTE